MFKKKSRAPMFFAIIIAAVVLMAAFVLPEILKSSQEVPETETETERITETEVPSHAVLIHKTNAGTIEFQSDWLQSDSDSETRLEIKENTLVSMKITPKDGKNLSAVNIYDAADVNNNINSVITELDNGKYNIDFTMPGTDIVMTFQFKEDAVSSNPDPVVETESETETETEGNPYGLTLHGVTADIITSFNGQFDDRDFLQQLGDALHMDSARSDYYKVTDVTFSSETYTGSKDSDKVYYYVYFNDDSNWKVLSTYYLKENTYVFTEPAIEETEPETTAASENGTYNNAGSSTSTGTQASPYVGSTGGNGASTSTTTYTTTFDIMSVSTVFLAFTGDNNSSFYDKAFEYVLEKGMTGEIVGTMNSYEIDPEKKTATFSITLNTGATITGTYKKSNNSYKFSGL